MHIVSLRMYDGDVRTTAIYQYNVNNPIAQNKWITISLAGVLDVVQPLSTAENAYFHISYSTLAFQAVTGNFSTKIALKV